MIRTTLALATLLLLAPGASRAQSEASEDAACRAQVTTPEAYRACRNRGVHRLDQPQPGDPDYLPWLERQQAAIVNRGSQWQVVDAARNTCTPLPEVLVGIHNPVEVLALAREEDPLAGYTPGTEPEGPGGSRSMFVEVYTLGEKWPLANGYQACAFLIRQTRRR